MRKLLWVMMVLVLGTAGVMGFNTVRYKKSLEPEPSVPLLAVDQDAVLDRLSAALRLETVSHQDPRKTDPEPFLAFHALLDQSYPALARVLEKEIINQYALLYRWPGKNPDLAPAALLAHFDVVPVAPETLGEWTHPPFGGIVADGFVWGRGTLDMKGSLMAIMEAAEALAQQGFAPERTLYFAFGHDEEVGGANGAAQISKALSSQGIGLAFTLDEGMVVLDEGFSPSRKPLAVIGVAEKGYLSLEVLAKGEGGHSSMPGLTTAIGTLARAAQRLETSQMPAKISGAAALLFEAIGPDLPLAQQVLFANLWAFKPLVLWVLERSKTTNAMIRTTTALTMISGGVKENVLPDRARLLVNFRILPGDSVEKILAHARNVIDDERVLVALHGEMQTEPSPVARIDTPAYAALKKSVAQVFEKTGVAPGLVLAGTDSKHYIGIADDSYRFAPFVLGAQDPARIHGVNERVPVAGYVRAIQFYAQLIRNAAGSPP